MTEYFRITGLNLIPFDARVTADPDTRYTLSQSPSGMDEPMTDDEVRSALSRLPLEVRGQALSRGLSRISFPFTIKGASDADMEDARHDLTETLEDGELYIATQGARGTRAVLQSKSNNAVQQSYKTIVYGEAMEMGGRAVLGGAIKEHFLLNLQMVLYCEPNWRPETAVTLGPNEIFCPGMEEDGDANGRADDWTALNVPTLTMESTIVLQGFYSQKVVTRNLIGDGIKSTVITAPAGVTSAACYAWIARPAAGSDITVQLYREGVGVVAANLYNTGGWDEATAKDGVTTFYRVEVSSAAGIVPAATYSLRIYNTAATITTLYVDKCFWKWDTATVPDEWCDHWNIYNHYDTTEGAAHEGHQNYFDVADLKGTDDTRLRLNIEQNTIATHSYYASIVMGRRNWWTGAELTPVRDVHWLEGEDAFSRSNWANAILARCSAGNCVSDAANAAGYVQWLATYVGPTGWRPWHWNTRWDVYGMLLTDNAAGTMYRLSYTGLGESPWYSNHWVQQNTDSAWQMTYLGTVNFDKFVSAPYNPASYYIRIEYAKTAIDTASLDCIWLIPSHEPQMRLHVPEAPWLTTSYAWFFDRTEDFDAEWAEFWDLYLQGVVIRQGDEMAFVPRQDNRLYISAESVNITPAPDEIDWEAHGGATDLQFTVSVDYVPQYRSPLD